MATDGGPRAGTPSSSRNTVSVGLAMMDRSMSCHHGVPTVNGSSWPSTVAFSSQATRVTTRSTVAIMAGAVRSCCCLSSELMKQTLHQYLQTARDAVVWKLDGLAEYDVRRPLVPTGTDLLGLVKAL